MIGQNKLVLNYATVIAAVQEYLDKRAINSTDEVTACVPNTENVTIEFTLKAEEAK